MRVAVFAGVAVAFYSMCNPPASSHGCDEVASVTSYIEQYSAYPTGFALCDAGLLSTPSVAQGIVATAYDTVFGGCLQRPVDGIDAGVAICCGLGTSSDKPAVGAEQYLECIFLVRGTRTYVCPMVSVAHGAGIYRGFCHKTTGRNSINSLLRLLFGDSASCGRCTFIPNLPQINDNFGYVRLFV